MAETLSPSSVRLVNTGFVPALANTLVTETVICSPGGAFMFAVWEKVGPCADPSADAEVRV